MLPTKAGIDEHFPLHLNYRSWCPHCVAGKARLAQHMVQPSDRERLGVTVHMDYAFMTAEEAEETMQPTLVVYDDDKMAFWALGVEQKGVTEGIVRYLAGILDQSGYQGQKITVKSDQEPSILALKKAVAAERVGETVPIESPVRSSKSNGMMENAVKIWQEQLRTIKHDVEAKFKKRIEVNSVLFSWLIPYITDIMNKYKVGVDGLTAYERITGHKCKHYVIGFAETVDYILETEKGKQYKADSRVGVGVFLGYVWRSTEYLIGTPDGVFRCRTIKRRAQEVSYDPSCFEFLNVKYDEYILKGARTKLHVTEPVGVDQSDIPTRGKDFVPRRAYILPKHYDTHGFTQGCRGCTWMQNKIGPRPGHTEECRNRMEAAIDKVEGDDTVKKAQERQDHFAAAQIEAGCEEDKRAQDPRQEPIGEGDPEMQGGSGDNENPPSTPAGAKNNATHFDIDQSPNDTDMKFEDVVFEDGPAASTDRRVKTPVSHPPTLEEELFLEDAPEMKVDRRLKTPTRPPATKRRALVGEMYTHDDEPDTKKIVTDEPDDNAMLGNLVFAHPGGGALLPGKVGCHDENRVIAVPEVGDVLTGVVGGSAPTVEPEVERQRAEDDLILSKAILGKSLHELYSNKRIELAISRKHMENINRQLDAVDVCEIFSPERVTGVCKQAGLEPGEAMDIKSGYDFDKLEDRN